MTKSEDEPKPKKLVFPANARVVRHPAGTYFAIVGAPRPPEPPEDAAPRCARGSPVRFGG
jgi:hypothetical protein